MSDANEKISTIDNSGNDYCKDCRAKAGLEVSRPELQKKRWFPPQKARIDYKALHTHRKRRTVLSQVISAAILARHEATT